MVDRARLRQFILDYFSDDELEDLTFDYFPDVQRLYTSRMNKSQKARELIDFADRRGRMDHLLAALESARTEAFCETFNIEPEPPPAPPPPLVRNPQQVFISYANPDQEFALRLADDLREAGFEVWIAPDSIEPGEKWVDAINRGLMGSGVFLLVLTPDAVSSKWVYDETSVAIALENKNQMRFLTLSVKPADAPPLWAIRQHISFEGAYERGFKSLLSALRPAKTTMLRPPAVEPTRPALAGIEPKEVDPERPVLTIDWPDGNRQTVALRKTLNRIGRSPDSDIVLDHEGISNSHVLLQVEGAYAAYTMRVTDLGSTNGTFLNGLRLPPHSARRLMAGDTLHLGDPSGLSFKLVAGLPSKSGSAGAPSPTQTITNGAAAAVSGTNGPAGQAKAVQQPEPAGAASRKRPVWLPIAALFVVIGIAAVAFMIRSNGGNDAGLPTKGAPTAGVELPTDVATAGVATDAVAAAVTSADTVAPTLTDTPSAAVTERATSAPARALAAASRPTVAPSATPTDSNVTPSATAGASATPTESSPAQVAANTTVLDSGSSLDFETFGLWTRGDQDNGTLTQSRTQTHGGASAARLDYDFPTAANDFVVFLQEHRISGTPNALRLWVYGDRSGHFLNAWILDSEGQTWQAPFGQVLHTGWREMTALIDTDQEWPWAHISGPDNGRVDYPIRFRGVVLDDVSADYTGKGTIYLDDLTTATIAGGDVVAAGSGDATPGPAAAEPASPGATGALFFTSGDSIYTTDPAWSSAQKIGTAESNTCFAQAKVAGGSPYTLDPAPFCNIGGGTAVCASPDGQYEVLVGTTVAGRSILVRPTATEGGNFVFDGGVDQTEGILWSATSASFLFVSGDTVYRVLPDGSNQAILQSAYSPQFSPDGRRIAFVRTNGSARDVYVWSEGTGERNVTNLGLADISCPRWAAGP